MKTGVVFGRVRSKSINTRRSNQAGRKYQYKLSTGTELFTDDNIKTSTWLFAEVEVDNFGNHLAVSHVPLATGTGRKMQEALRKLKLSSHQTVEMWKTIDANDRLIVAKTIGVGLGCITGTATAIGAVQGLSAFVLEECLLGAVTGGLSLVATGGIAVLTAMQEEDRKKALAAKTDIMNRWFVLRKQLSDHMTMHMPIEYRYLEPLDPQSEGIVSQCKYFIENFNHIDLIKAKPESDFQFAFAR